MLEQGSSVPKFEADDSDGNKIRSSDFKGKKYVIYFYPKGLYSGVHH